MRIFFIVLLGIPMLFFVPAIFAIPVVFVCLLFKGGSSKKQNIIINNYGTDYNTDGRNPEDFYTTPSGNVVEPPQPASGFQNIPDNNW